MNPAASYDDVTPRQRLLISLSVMMGTMIYALDLTIANVALPHMAGTFSANQDQISWVLTSYIVATAIAAPCSGWLSGRVGRKRLFLACMAGFTFFSALCGAATSLEQEVLFRILQGGMGAFLVPVSQAIILDINPPEKHGQAMAFWGLGIMLGPIMGPTVGGYLTEWGSWRWVFYLSVPVGIVGYIGSYLFVPESEKDLDRRFDWSGFISLGLCLAALQLVFDRGNQKDWFDSTEIMIEATLAAVALYVFITHILTTKEPFLHPRLFTDRNFVIGMFFIFTFGLVSLVPMVLLPPFMADLLNYPITTVGLLLSPRGVGLMLAMMVSGRLVARMDPRLILMTGFIVQSYAAWEISQWTLDVGVWDIAMTGFIQGIGTGLVWVPITAVAFTTLAQTDRTEAASIFHLMRNVGSSIGISVAVTILTRTTREAHANLTEHITPYADAVQAADYPAVWSLASSGGAMALDHEVTRQASMIAFNNDFFVITLTTLVVVPLIFFMGKPPRAPEANQAEATTDDDAVPEGATEEAEPAAAE